METAIKGKKYLLFQTKATLLECNRASFTTQKSMFLPPKEAFSETKTGAFPRFFKHFHCTLSLETA